MTAYILRRLAYAVPIILGVNLITFVLFFMVKTPQEQAHTALGGRNITPEKVEQYLHEKGYNKPRFYNLDEESLSGSLTETIFYTKFVRLLAMDFGTSDQTGERIGIQIRKRMGPSLTVAIPTLIFGILLNMCLSMLVAYYRGTYIDVWGVVTCVGLMSISTLYYIIGLQYIFGKTLMVIPISGWSEGFDIWRFTIGSVMISLIGGIGGGVRFYRTVFLEELNRDYVRTARSKGLSEVVVLFRHVLRNALIPMVTSVMASLPFLFMGSLLLENFFAIPGLGSYTINALTDNDFGIVRSMVFLGSILMIIGLILTDITYALVDPRISFGNRGEGDRMWTVYVSVFAFIFIVAIIGHQTDPYFPAQEAKVERIEAAELAKLEDARAKRIESEGTDEEKAALAVEKKLKAEQKKAKEEERLAKLQAEQAAEKNSLLNRIQEPAVANTITGLLIMLGVFTGYRMSKKEYWRNACRQIYKRKMAMVSLGIVLLYMAIALLDSISWRDPVLDSDNNIVLNKTTGEVELLSDSRSILDRMWLWSWATFLVADEDKEGKTFTKTSDAWEKTYSKPSADKLLQKTQDPDTGERRHEDLKYKGSHILGTAKAGGDTFYHSLKGVRTGIIIGLVTTLLALPFSLLFGLMAGYFGGWVDDLVQYLYSTLTAIPSLLLIMAFILIYGQGLTQICIVLGITSWVGLCRLLRGETLKLREMEYVQAGTALGTRRLKIMWRHLLPNLMHLVLINFVLAFSAQVLSESVLSYLGVGVGANTGSWGNMINDARMELARDPLVWWPLAGSFIFMFLLILPANLFADAVRDALDPRLRAK